MPDDIQTEFEQIRERITEVLGEDADKNIELVLRELETTVKTLCYMFYRAGQVSRGQEIVDEMERNTREKP